MFKRESDTAEPKSRSKLLGHASKGIQTTLSYFVIITCSQWAAIAISLIFHLENQSQEGLKDYYDVAIPFIIIMSLTITCFFFRHRKSKAAFFLFFLVVIPVAIAGFIVGPLLYSVIGMNFIFDGFVGGSICALIYLAAIWKRSNSHTKGDKHE